VSRSINSLRISLTPVPSLQLPPVVKNMAFQKYSHMDQSLFTRFVRLGTPYVELNAQGRARPSIAKLYNWRYRQLGDLPYVQQRPEFQVGCPFEVLGD
jgi:intron-binding protein aquarius